MSYLGDFPEDFTTLTCMFTTHAATGAPVAPSSGFEAADVIIYKNGSGTQKTSTNGVTMTSPFDSITGLHCLVIDTSNDTGDGGFWVPGAMYTLVLSPDETVDSLAVAKVIGTFGIALAPAFARLGAPAGASVSADIAAVKAQTAAIEVDTAEIGAAGAGLTNINLPNQTMDIVGNITGNLSGSVGSVTGLTVAHIDAAISSRASQTSVDDLPTNAELATALGTADDAVLAQIALVKAKTDNLPSDPADQSIVIAATDAILTAVSTVDTVVDAIQAKTDNLPSDPADASVIAGRFDTLDTSVADLPTNAELATALGTADDAVLTAIGDLPTNAELATALAGADDAVLAQVALVKAKTDLIPAAPAAVTDIPTASQIADAVHDEAVDGTTTFRESTRLQNAALAGKASGLDTTTATFRDLADTKDRITATVDADGNRTAVTLDAS